MEFRSLSWANALLRASKLDGGVDFVDGATPPCEGDTSGVCVIEDGGVIIPTEDGGTTQCFFIQCDGRVTACGDCSDNDGDGLIDNRDPECLGPCDNYEGEELLSGVGGETGEQCKADCYFDFGNGAGNDDCRWSRSCDPLEPKVQCTYDEGRLGSRDCPETQSQLCEDVCVPLTPNGCDCFGCCTFPELDGEGPGGGPGYVYIGSESGCTFDTVTDPAHCQACTPAGSEIVGTGRTSSAPTSLACCGASLRACGLVAMQICFTFSRATGTMKFSTWGPC